MGNVDGRVEWRVVARRRVSCSWYIREKDAVPVDASGSTSSQSPATPAGTAQDRYRPWIKEVVDLRHVNFWHYGPATTALRYRLLEYSLFGLGAVGGVCCPQGHS